MTTHRDPGLLADELLTAPDGRYGLHLTEEAQARVAVFASGRVYVLEGALRHPDVQTIIGVLDNAGHHVQIDKPTIVDNGTLRGIYEGKVAFSAASLVPVGPTENNDSEKREDAYRLLVRGLRTIGTSDLIVKYQPDHASVHAMVDGVQANLFDLNWSTQYALEFQKAVYSWAGEDAGSAELGWRHNAHQMGSITVGLPRGLDSVRIELIATAGGGKELVMRLQPTPPNGKIELAELNFVKDDLRCFRSIMQNGGGLVIVTGPTGHGKTRTLYGLQEKSLKMFPGDRWINVENPIEIRRRHPNVTQIDVVRTSANGDTAQAYQDALAAAMRGVPKRLIIGEIRTPDEADVAIRAALTGHGVLTSMHTPDAMGAILRLIDLGVSENLICNQRRIRAVIGQRLLRRVCPECCRKIDRDDWEQESPEWLDEVFAGTDHLRAANNKGCSHCRHGYVPGRIPLVEIIRPDTHLLKLLIAGEDTHALAHWTGTLQGQPLLSQVAAGLKSGLFDPFEALRCTDF